jgi:hypothetical protein
LNTTLGRTTFRMLVLAILPIALVACASGRHWPWHHRHTPPQAVHVVTLQSDNASGIVQYWDRNTLQFDLTALSGEGAATLTPVKSVGWPIRLEFKVRPGRFGRLEVIGVQRVVFDLPSQGKDLVLKLAPDAYLPETERITLRWSAAGDSAH